ncbi:hypothetical protein SUGI_0321610 [Cryptomeria japonica]|uniref:probable WRKY transcription factor 43 n=1 Tax=Cryptomeria japonica TaxID=3369 RepID=UPI002408C7E8|nr:probable WRKY transcription factor 43 [Cryptomeria japonica]GLJ18191.1 hypothetical protein SUGI_0321610 [Cryptomeria japonica]
MESEHSDRTARPKNIVLRLRSETESLEDGYAWKKYGQKSIKNKTYARSYFRCKERGCNVKKQTQRCCDDPEFVLISYQGLHNHSFKPESTLSCGYDLRVQFFQQVPDSRHQGTPNSSVSSVQ